MSELRTYINDAFIKAMKDRNEVEKAAISLIRSELKSKDIAARPNRTAIDDSEILDMLQKMIKQRTESLAMYKQGGRDDLASKEQDEINVISKFLPKQMNEDEIILAINDAIKATSAASIKDMGAVVSVLKEKYSGKMDFSKVAALIKSKLS